MENEINDKQRRKAEKRAEAEEIKRQRALVKAQYEQMLADEEARRKEPKVAPLDAHVDIGFVVLARLQSERHVLVNGQVRVQRSMRSEIIKLHKAINATTIYVTHDQTEAMTMASRIVVIQARLFAVVREQNVHVRLFVFLIGNALFGRGDLRAVELVVRRRLLFVELDFQAAAEERTFAKTPTCPKRSSRRRRNRARYRSRSCSAASITCISISPPSYVQSNRFIAGAPINVATNMLAGLL